MRRPCLAATPIEASMAIGVASASEQEQATTSTAATASGLRETRKVIAATATTTGRK